MQSHTHRQNKNTNTNTNNPRVGGFDPFFSPFCVLNCLVHAAVHADLFCAFSNVGSVNCPNMIAFDVNVLFQLVYPLLDG